MVNELLCIINPFFSSQTGSKTPFFRPAQKVHFLFKVSSQQNAKPWWLSGFNKRGGSLFGSFSLQRESCELCTPLRGCKSSIPAIFCSLEEGKWKSNFLPLAGKQNVIAGHRPGALMPHAITGAGAAWRS
jgi:hypothetical protein